MTDLPPVFVVSTGRAGSKMIARLLAQHGDLYAVHEPMPYLSGEAFAAWSGIRTVHDITRSVRGKRSRLLGETAANGLLYVESNHYCAHLIPVLRDLYGARFVHLYRDGRAFVRSGLERGTWYPEQPRRRPFTGEVLRHHVKRYLRRYRFVEVGDRWEDHKLQPPRHLRTRLEKIAWLWAEINGCILEASRQVPREAWFELPVERLDREAVQALAAFIGVAAAPDTIEDMLRVARRRPNRTARRSVPAFGDWEPAERDAFWAVAEPMMQRLGYVERAIESG